MAQLNKDNNPVKLIGNLPFNISTPLLLKYLDQISTRSGLFQFDDPSQNKAISMLFMFQAEVADVNFGFEITFSENRCSKEFKRILSVIGHGTTSLFSQKYHDHSP